ncbi:MAG: hypothetical protein UZ17_ACD001001283 [Acidobacteria bacterium OLB17]|nr:MAG: hypothetical protein UZ17_ACD001001283 [Acidobacteria bacterium OLB17]
MGTRPFEFFVLLDFQNIGHFTALFYQLIDPFKRKESIDELKMKTRNSVRTKPSAADDRDDLQVMTQAYDTHESARFEIPLCKDGRSAVADILGHCGLALYHLAGFVKQLYDERFRDREAGLFSQIFRQVAVVRIKIHFADMPESFVLTMCNVV